MLFIVNLFFLPVCLDFQNYGRFIDFGLVKSMSTKDLALRIVKDQFGILAEVRNGLSESC